MLRPKAAAAIDASSDDAPLSQLAQAPSVVEEPETPVDAQPPWVPETQTQREDEPEEQAIAPFIKRPAFLAVADVKGKGVRRSIEDNADFIRATIEVLPSLGLLKRDCEDMLGEIAKQNGFKFKSDDEKTSWQSTMGKRLKDYWRQINLSRYKKDKAPAWFRSLGFSGEGGDGNSDGAPPCRRPAAAAAGSIVYSFGYDKDTGLAYRWPEGSNKKSHTEWAKEMVPPDQSSETDPMVAIFSDGSTKSVMQTTVKKWMAEFGDSATLRRPAAAAAAARAAAPTGAAAAATTPELFVGYMDTEKIDVHFRWDAPGGRKIRYICLRHAGQGQIVQLNVEAFAADGESIAVSSQRSKLEKLAAEWMNPIAKKYAEGTLDKEGVCNKKKEDFPQTQMKRRPAAAAQLLGESLAHTSAAALKAAQVATEGMQSLTRGHQAQVADAAYFEEELMKMFIDSGLQDMEIESEDDDDTTSHLKDKLDRQYDHFLELCAMENFEVDADSQVGKRFRRWCAANQARKAEYDKKDCDAKALARKEWAKQKYEEYQETRSKMKQQIVSRQRKGQMLNFEQILDKEGGSVGAIPSAACVKGAVESCKWAILQQAKNRNSTWVAISKRSKRLTFKYVEETEIEDDRTTWNTEQRETNPVVKEIETIKPAPATAATATPGTASQPTAPLDTPLKPSKEKEKRESPKEKKDKRDKDKKDKGASSRAKAKAKGKGTKRRGGAGSGGDTAKAMHKRAFDLTLSYGAATTQASALLNKIESKDEEWSWADNKKFKGSLQKALETLKTAAAKNEDINKMLCMGASGVEIRTDMTIDDDTTNLPQLSVEFGEVEDAIDSVKAAAARIKSIKDGMSSESSQ
ncbi:unnamed protein product [Prorocentrum cordatum]|uniref:Uncharacterized protein n=1 Tax=Prorocentrum cordatum TaxID=2364126 RepID=A0ABN9XQX1_9DINO|nr:unnamed protein product [Polarella glacialis]